MKFRCIECKRCPYCYGGDFCTLTNEYVDDMNYCPDNGEFEEVKDYFYDENGEKIYYEELQVNNKW